MMDVPDLSLTWIISLSATVLLLTYFWFSRRNPKYPPCPLRPWPIVGNLLQLNPDPREQLAGFKKQCGDIYSLYMGSTHLVILSGLDVAKEVFIKRGDEFSDRANTFLDYITDGFDSGISATNGAAWTEHKDFTLSMLRNFGSRGNTIADIIQEELDQFMALLESLNGEPRNLHSFISISVSNVICSIIVGQRYEYDDQDFLRLQESMFFNYHKYKGTIILNYLPWLRFLPGDLFYCKVMREKTEEFYNTFTRRHLEVNKDVVGEPGNLIAAYYQEIKAKKLAGKKTHLDSAHLPRLVLDLYGGGTEPTTSTLYWFLLYMVNYQEIQEKIFQEIKEGVGLDRPPNMQDKSQLVYLEATIMEVQRVIALLPLGFPRAVSRDVKLHGYVIPRGTTIVVNFDSLLKDPSIWGQDAHKFQPERFIDKDGCLVSPEAWVPYSLGKRSCIGEAMAKMELFLFVSNILQKFQVLPASQKAVPPLNGTLGLTYTAVPYEVRMVCRRSSS